MTKENWEETYNNVLDTAAELLQDKVGLAGPGNWSQARKIILEFVNEIDELTEVYNKENKQ